MTVLSHKLTLRFSTVPIVSPQVAFLIDENQYKTCFLSFKETSWNLHCLPQLIWKMQVLKYPGTHVAECPFADEVLI